MEEEELKWRGSQICNATVRGGSVGDPLDGVVRNYEL